MGLFIRNEGPRTELQARIAAELQEKQKNQPSLEAEKVDPAFLDNQHHTRSAGVILVVLALAAIVVTTIIVSVN
ncbi:hypothetical protein H7Y40_01200 [Pedobacter sp.]|nr:hypothetical protein [Candidatus Saccharibacteria bacterium]